MTRATLKVSPGSGGFVGAAVGALVGLAVAWGLGVAVGAAAGAQLAMSPATIATASSTSVVLLSISFSPPESTVTWGSIGLQPGCLTVVSKINLACFSKMCCVSPPSERPPGSYLS
jgi:hypothetical protein